jgi:DNA repair ATPase RecN
MTNYQFKNQHNHIYHIEKLLNNIEYEIQIFGGFNNNISTRLDKRLQTLKNRLEYLCSDPEDCEHIHELIDNAEEQIGKLKREVYDYNLSSTDSNDCLFKVNNNEKIVHHNSSDLDDNMDVVIQKGLKFTLGNMPGETGDNKDFIIITYKGRSARIELDQVV